MSQEEALKQIEQQLGLPSQDGQYTTPLFFPLTPPSPISIFVFIPTLQTRPSRFQHAAQNDIEVQHLTSNYNGIFPSQGSDLLPSSPPWQIQTGF